MSAYIEFVKSDKFDSRILPPNAGDPDPLFEFRIELRVNLRRLNPTNGKAVGHALDANGNASPIIRWDDASWLHFKIRYLKNVVQVWDKAFLLIAPKSYDGFTWPAQGKRRDLLCRMSLHLRDDPSLAHVSIPVVRLQFPTPHLFRVDAHDYSSDMSEPWARSIDSTQYTQNLPAHEVGHLLGLDHINGKDPLCETGGQDICYGSNLTERLNIMGTGSHLSLIDARPWLRRIHTHAPPTHRRDWTPGWASAAAIMRGDGIKWIDEQLPEPVSHAKPGLIDI